MRAKSTKQTREHRNSGWKAQTAKSRAESYNQYEQESGKHQVFVFCTCALPDGSQLKKSACKKGFVFMDVRKVTD